MVILLSIIGCVTGVASLVVQGLNYRLSLPKITCTQSKRHNSYWVDGATLENVKQKPYPDDFDELAISTYVSILSLRIANNSANPITINDISKVGGGTKEITSDSFTPLIYDSKKVMFCEKPFELPLRIDPYNTVNGSIAFFDVVGSPDGIKSEKIKIDTPYKNFIVTLNVKSIDLLANEQQKQNDKLAEYRNSCQEHGKDL